MLKWSDYNQFVSVRENKFIVYNHLTKRMIKIKKSSKDFQRLSKKMIEYLIKLGFLVDEKTDEKRMAMLYYYDYIYDKSLRLVILPNEDCNFRCTFCYENFNGVYMDQKNLDSIIIFLRKNITKYSSLDVDWFGGEPLLSLNSIYQFSDKAKQLCKIASIPYRAAITTNGYLLDAETLLGLLRCKVTIYQITLCGNEEQHDAIRYLKNGCGSFQKIINNLLEIKRLDYLTFKMVIRINVTKSMLGTLSDLIDWLSDLFGGDERFLFYFRPVGDWGGNRVQSISDELYVNHDELFRELFKAKGNLNYDIYYSLLSNNICAAAKRNNYVIRANGDINKCTESLYSEYNKVGILTEEGKMEINKELLAKWLFTYYKNEVCLNCVKYELCNNRKCPDNCLKKSTAVEAYCGYEDVALEEIIKLLDLSKSKYIQDIL